MDADTSFDIAVQSEFENWANNFEFAEYYFQFIDENENDAYDGGEIYAVSCEGDTSMTVAYDGSVYALQFEYFWMEAYDFDWESDDDDDNILPNGGFEDVYEAGNGWQFYATDWIWHPTYAVNHHVELTGNYIYGSYIPFEAYDGDYSLKLWGQYSGAENKTAYYQTFTDLEAGTEIHAEAMLMSHQDHWIGNGSNTVTVFASYWDAGWSFIGRDDSEVFSGADEYNMWHERGVDAVVPEGVSYVNIGLEFSQMDDSQGGSVYIDNMNVHIYDDDGDREDNSRNYDALTFAQDYVNDNSSDWGENAFDLESEFSLVVDGDYVSGGLGGDDPGNCEINWPEDPYKMAVYSFVSEYVLVEGGSVGCFLDDGDLDQTYADFVMGMENEWAGGGGGDDEPIFFEKEDYADVSDPANWDQITESVAITRADNQGLFNPYSESSYNELGEYGPAGTLWAPMSTEEATMLDTNVYTSWHAAMNNNPQSFIDETVSLWCLEEDKYYDIVMASWTNGNNGGGFSYWRYPADGHDEEDDGPDLLIMNMDLMEFFMVSFGMDLDSLDIENPTVIGFGSSSDDENMVMGLMFDETGVIELMADSEEAAAATSIDETSITFTNLSLYDSTGTAVLTVTGTIGPGWIDFEAGVETPIDLFNEDGEEENREFYLSLSEDSTGMGIDVEYDDYYGEEYSDTSYFDWSATTDSLFLYFEIDYYYYYYYYEDEADTMALGYMIIEDTLFASASFNPCEDDGYESYEECFGDGEFPGFDELVDVESFRVNQETVFTSTVLTSIVGRTNVRVPAIVTLLGSPTVTAPADNDASTSFAVPATLKTAFDHDKPVFSLESAVKTCPLVPTVTLLTTLSAVPAIKSPLASTPVAWIS